jgi:SNF2 family DNA or RNA helicase
MRVVLDEAQRVNKRGRKRHEAIKRLSAEAFIILSGTLLHNKSHDFSGYVNFLRGHPFGTHQKFMNTFSLFRQLRADGQT